MELEISTDPARLDVATIHRFLSATYWAQGRSREVVERTLRHSLCFGAYADGRQIAFARAVTDRAVFAYLADVFVIPEFRGQGVARRLIDAVLAHPELASVHVYLLRTRDAHGLYARCGFQPLPRPEEMMARHL